MSKKHKKPSIGYDGHLHIRCASDLPPLVHAHARARGYTAASWMRSVIIEALERAGANHRSDEAA